LNPCRPCGCLLLNRIHPFTILIGQIRCIFHQITELNDKSGNSFIKSQTDASKKEQINDEDRKPSGKIVFMKLFDDRMQQIGNKCCNHKRSQNNNTDFRYRNPNRPKLQKKEYKDKNK